MAKKRVAAYFMHEYEEDVAALTLEDQETGSAFVIGLTDESGIARMRRKGLIVEIIEEIKDRKPQERERIRRRPAKKN